MKSLLFAGSIAAVSLCGTAAFADPNSTWRPWQGDPLADVPTIPVTSPAVTEAIPSASPVTETPASTPDPSAVPSPQVAPVELSPSEEPAPTVTGEVAPAPMVPSAKQVPLVAYAAYAAPPALVITTAAKTAVFGGILGAVAAVSDGAKTASTYAIEDPANVIAAKLAEALAARRGGTVAGSPIILTDEKGDPAPLNIEKARYIVRVARSQIQIIYFPLDWTHYGAIYSTTLRVIDTSTGAAVAKSKCVLTPKKTDDSPTHRELMNANAARLKAMIVRSGEDCLAKFEAEISKL